jgi:biopolymer transport protein ExbD
MAVNRSDTPPSQGIPMAIGIGNSAEDETIGAINTTPLVDVMLVLLIIFLITIPVVTSSVKVELPKESNQVRQTQPENVIISIDEGGHIFLYDTPVPDTKELMARLKVFAEHQPQPEVQIRGDGSSGIHHRTQFLSRTNPNMGMNTRSHGSSQEPEVLLEINTTPLIDVMLVLLIMLIITIPTQLHSVNLDMPQNAHEQKIKTEPEIIRIDIDAQNHWIWNGQILKDHEALESKLASSQSLPVQPELHIRADPKSKYERVVAVLAGAQRHGLNKLGIVGTEQYNP